MIKFAEGFRVDAANRLRVDNVKELPNFILAGRDIRAALREKTREVGLPDLPHSIHSAEDFSVQAREQVGRYWVETVGEQAARQATEWAGEIGDEDEYQELKSNLVDPAKLEECLQSRKLAAFEQLRVVNPDAWKTLLIYSHERQLASVELARHWIKTADDEYLQPTGLSKKEWTVFLYFAGILGKYFDQAYIKQMEMADLDGGSEESELSELSGGESLYDFEVGDTKEVKTYKEMFTLEWPKIVDRMNFLADKVEQMVKSNDLPADKYANLAGFIRQAAEAYGSEDKDPAVLDKIWQNLYEAGTELIKDGCPIVFVPQGSAEVTGDAGKVDVEMRLALHTNKEKELEYQFDGVHHNAQMMVNERINYLNDKNFKVPDVVLSVQPFAFGPNLHAVTEGEAGEKFMLVNVDAVKEAAGRQYKILQKVFSVDDIDTNKFERAVLSDTVNHELSHNIMSTDDKAVKKRIGYSSNVGILDEIKADTLGIGLSVNTTSDEEGDRYVLLSKISTVLTSTIGKTGIMERDPHYFAGAAIIAELLDQGIIVQREKQFVITDVRKGLSVLADLGNTVLQTMYCNEQATPKDTAKYISGLKKKIKNSGFNNFKNLIDLEYVS